MYSLDVRKFNIVPDNYITDVERYPVDYGPFFEKTQKQTCNNEFYTLHDYVDQNLYVFLSKRKPELLQRMEITVFLQLQSADFSTPHLKAPVVRIMFFENFSCFFVRL